jgi:hypothetical protein
VRRYLRTWCVCVRVCLTSAEEACPEWPRNGVCVSSPPNSDCLLLQAATADVRNWQRWECSYALRVGGLAFPSCPSSHNFDALGQSPICNPALTFRYVCVFCPGMQGINLFSPHKQSYLIRLSVPCSAALASLSSALTL